MENQKEKIVSAIALVAFALMVVTATYAYFQAQVGDPAAVDVSINADTVDTFTFSTGKVISINLNQESFASGAGNLVGSTTATATLTANSKTNTATEHYYLYLNISNNTYTYSIDEDTPEIILTVTDSSGNEVTDISGLTYVSATGATGSAVSGYDITNKSGLITLLSNREITTTSTKEDVWTVTITFINYDANQANNAGKSLSAKILIQQEKIVQTVANVCQSGQTLSSCIIAMNGIDDTLYYHNGTITSDDGTVLDANDGSYRYAGASASVNNFVCIGSTETTCPDANLFRIIGVFNDQVKVIKATSIGDMYWDTGGSNTWSTSSLYKYLNGLDTNAGSGYIDSISSFSSKIATATWKVGGNTLANIEEVTPAVAYTNEMTSTNVGTDNNYEISAQIGLMYVSDYEFAASPTAWTLVGRNSDSTKDYRAATSINWLYLGSIEWTISHRSDYSRAVFYVNSTGQATNFYVDYYSYAVRPVFYLESSATYSSEVGSSSNPIKLG